MAFLFLLQFGRTASSNDPESALNLQDEPFPANSLRFACTDLLSVPNRPVAGSLLARC